MASTAHAEHHAVKITRKIPGLCKTISNTVVTIRTSCKLMIFGCSPYRSSNSISSYGSCFDLSIICQSKRRSTLRDYTNQIHCVKALPFYFSHLSLHSYTMIHKTTVHLRINVSDSLSLKSNVKSKANNTVLLEC